MRPAARMAQHGSAPAQKTAQHSPARNPPSTGFCAGAGRGCAGLRCALSCAVRWAALGILRWPCAGAGLRWRWAALCAGCAGAGLRWRWPGLAGLLGSRGPWQATQHNTTQTQTFRSQFLGPWQETQTQHNTTQTFRSQFLCMRNRAAQPGSALGVSYARVVAVAQGCAGDPALGLRWRWAALALGCAAALGCAGLLRWACAGAGLRWR